MPNNVADLSENIKSYTEARNAANELLKYVSFASLTELLEVQSVVSDLVGKNANTAEDGKICEKLLSSVSSIPLYDQMFEELAKGNVITKLGTGSARIQHTAQPANLKIKSILALNAQDADILKRKRISMVQHAAKSRVDFASALTDISAAFCSLIPPTEMSLCVPLFDVRIIYPQDSPGKGLLSTLRFVGVKAEDSEAQGSASVTTGYTSEDSQSSVKYGYDVAGMEVFCLPQTLSAPPFLINNESDLQSRGLPVLDPLMPLMSLESATIQQIGINGSLYAQTKIDLSIVLHDRSRLSDIESLVSAEVFPTVTFRVSYGWLHPDNNKFTGNVYAKLLNSMRVTQDFAVSSVSLRTKDATSIAIAISLISTGSQVSKGAKIMTANGKYIPFAAVQTLLKQFIRVKSVKSKSKDEPVDFERVGSTNTISVSKGTTTGNYVKIEDFYNLYELVSSLSGDDAQADETKFEQIVKSLDSLEKTGVYTPADQEFKDIFDFQAVQSANGSVPYGSLSATNLVDVPQDLATKIDKINKEANKTTAPGEGNRPAVVPLSALVAKLVAKPLLLTQPDIEEVRIHFFSFNSACGKMSEINIGNFPIEIKQIIEHTEGDKKEVVEGINQRTSAESALGMLLKHVNNPASIYFGHNVEFEKSRNASQAVQESTASAEEKQEKLDNIAKESAQAIDTNNPKYMVENGAQVLTDGAFVPARVKSQIDVLPAYDVNEDSTKPSRKIARIIIYDDRAGGFNKLGNLVFSMMNTNGIARVVQSGFNSAAVSDELKKTGSTYTITDLFSQIQSTEKPQPDGGEPLVTFALRSKQIARSIASNLYPNIIIGSDSTNIINATYSSQPSGEVASGYLLSALQGGSSSSTSGQGTSDELAGDVFILPSNVTLNMIGNPLITRGQTYYIDFSTGTTLDNSYTVQAVTHTIRPGSFTTSVNLIPTNSATMRSVTRQLQELAIKVRGKTGKKTDPAKSSFDAARDDITLA